MMPSGPSATSLTAAASVTIENTISDALAAARGVSAKRMPALINACAFSRDRFQPVTVCPAAIRRGTIPAPMAPSPMNPMFMRSPCGPPRSRAAMRSSRGGAHLLALVALGPQLVVAVHRNVEIVAVRIDRPIFRVEPVARALERRAVALLLELGGDRVVVVDLEAEMIEARRLAVDLVGVDREVEISV